MLPGDFTQVLTTLIFTNCHILHFRRDDALACIVHLRNILADFSFTRLFQVFKTKVIQLFIITALVTILRREAGQEQGIITLFDP